MSSDALPFDPQALRATAEEESFSGVVAVQEAAGPVFAEAFGLADRAHAVPNAPGTRFALASGGKGFTALVVMSLVEEGVLALDTPVRSILGADLPLIDDAVTIEHLLSHTSGIGDYLDESGDGEITDHVLTQPVHVYTDVEAFLPDLDGHPQEAAPGETFKYNNGGFMVLALVAQRASGVSYHELVRTRVIEKAGLAATGFLRSDELPADAALGYLDESGPRTNVFHLPILGSGDGGIYSTADDLDTLWRAFLAGRIVGPHTVELMTTPRNVDEEESLRYGLGLYLAEDGPGVILTGYDAGVSFFSTHDPDSGQTRSILSNTSEGAWELIAYVSQDAGDDD